MTDLRQVFDDLVRFETILWGAVDARLQEECGVGLASLNAMLVIDATPLCRVHDIARAVAITVGGASQAVDRLESMRPVRPPGQPLGPALVDRGADPEEHVNSCASPPPSSTASSTACCGSAARYRPHAPPMPLAHSAGPRLPRQAALRLAGPPSESRTNPPGPRRPGSRWDRRLCRPPMCRACPSEGAHPRVEPRPARPGWRPPRRPARSPGIGGTVSRVRWVSAATGWGSCCDRDMLM